ncbi:MAG: PIN domain-containing protein [Tagaea sp.]
MPGSFLDTNVLVYLASADAKKADRAASLLVEGGTISVQVLNELANVARRRMDLSWDEVAAFLEPIRETLTVRPLTVETHEMGLALARRYRWSVYDGMIVASAIEAGCARLWSEDLQHGMKLAEGLKIENPFQ